MDCNRIIDATFLCFDNEMDPEMRVDFEAHLRRCPHCSRRREVVIACLLLIRRSPACRCRAPKSLAERIRQLLQEGAQEGMGPESGAASPNP